MEDASAEIFRQHLLNRQTGILERHSIYINSLAIGIQDDDDVRDGVDNASKFVSVLPDLLFTDLNEVSTSYFFVRQLGNTFGVTAATVMFDHRQTLHSSRLVDVANRLDPTLQSTLSQYSSLIARDGGAASNPALGAVQIFQSNVITESRLLSYIDIYFGFAVLSVVVLCLIIVLRPKHVSSPVFPHKL